MKKINESIICAGFGGQGIMTLGKVLANAGMEAGYNVTSMPSYGAEVRGGTAHAIVRISSSLIASPIAEEVDTAVFMNEPSMEKFGGKVKKGGLVIINTSMVPQKEELGDVSAVFAPLTEEAIQIGSIRVANMIAAGIYIARKPVLDKDILTTVMRKMAAGRERILPVNIRAVERGIEIGQERG